MAEKAPRSRTKTGPYCCFDHWPLFRCPPMAGFGYPPRVDRRFVDAQLPRDFFHCRACFQRRAKALRKASPSEAREAGLTITFELDHRQFAIGSNLTESHMTGTRLPKQWSQDLQPWSGQNISLRATCIWRGLPTVEVTVPTAPLPMVAFGWPNCGWLNRLKLSARN